MIAIFENETVFNTIKSFGPLPSGVILGEPLVDTALGRRAAIYEYTAADQAYLLSFTGVQLVSALPDDWGWPEL